jgi:hypothetical protein
LPERGGSTNEHARIYHRCHSLPFDFLNCHLFSIFLLTSFFFRHTLL